MTTNHVPSTDDRLTAAVRHAVHELNNLLGAAHNLAILAETGLAEMGLTELGVEGQTAAAQVGLVRQAVAASIEEVAALSAAAGRPGAA